MNKHKYPIIYTCFPRGMGSFFVLVPDLERLRPFFRLPTEFCSFGRSASDDAAGTGRLATPVGSVVSVSVCLAGGLACLTVGVATEGARFVGRASDGRLLLSLRLVDFCAVDLCAGAFLFTSSVFLSCHVRIHNKYHAFAYCLS